MMAEAVISGLGVACRLPLTVVAEGGCMAIKGLEQAVEPQPYQQNGGARCRRNGH